jgi:hypothetical protein
VLQGSKQLTKTFDTFLDEFNVAAEKTRQDPRSLPFVAAEYRALLAMKAPTDEERTDMASRLLDAGVYWLNYIAQPAFDDDIDDAVDIIKPAFDALTSPASLRFLTTGMEEKIADAAIAVAKKGRTLPAQDNATIAQNDTRTSFTRTLLALAHMAADAACTVKAELDSRTVSIETSKPLVASKPLQLQNPRVPA